MRKKYLKNSNKFAQFAIGAHTFQLSRSLIINDLKNKHPSPTDFLRTLSQTSSKSPQKLISSSFLTERSSLTLGMTLTESGEVPPCGAEESVLDSSPIQTPYLLRGLPLARGRIYIAIYIVYVMRISFVPYRRGQRKGILIKSILEK